MADDTPLTVEQARAKLDIDADAVVNQFIDLLQPSDIGEIFAEREPETLALDAAEALWGVVANVRWDDQSPEWIEAAKRARDLYHTALNAAYPPVGSNDPPG